jgi:hypothetical protein
MTDVWRRAARLSPRHWLGLLEASSTLAWAHASLRWRSPAGVIARATSVRPSSRRVARAAPAPATTGADRARVVSRMVWFVGAASRHFMRVPCLSRSVALARMLARRGIAADIRIGVRTQDGGLDAHAWVELDGRVINDDETVSRSYAPFDRPLAQVTELRRLFR